MPGERGRHGEPHRPPSATRRNGPGWASDVSRRDVLKSSGLVPLVSVAGLGGQAESASARVVGPPASRPQLGTLPAIIDDFEDGNLSEYTKAGKGIAEIQSDVVFEGNRAFHATVPTDGSAGGKVHSTSGLDHYPARGDTFSVVVKMTTSRTDGFVDFGYQDTANRYEMRMRKRAGGTFELHRLSDGRRTVLANSSQSWGTGWYEIEFDWSEDGPITITAYEDPGGARTQVNQISATDTTFTDGGIGFHCAGTRGGPRHYYADLAQITSRGSAPGSVELVWDTPADWDSAQAQSGVVHEAVANTDHVDAGVVKQGYSVANPLAASGLVGYWPLQEKSGVTAYDFSGNGHHATVNGATQGASGLLGTSAYAFDGTNDYVVIPDDDALDVERIALSAWIHPDSVGQHRIVTKDDHDVDRSWDLYVADGKDRDGRLELKFHASIGGSLSLLRPGDAHVPTGVWSHVAATYDGSAMKLYIDGTLTGENTDPSGSLDASTMDVTIGTYGDVSQDWFDGRLSAVRIYDRALSASEVQALYDVATTPGTITTASKEAN